MATQVSAVDALVDCELFPDDPSCFFVPASDDLTLNVTMQSFGGDWTVPFSVTTFASGSVTGTGETTGTDVRFGLGDAQVYTVALDLSSTPFQAVSFTCNSAGSGTTSSYTFTHALGNDVTCDAVVMAPGGFVDVVVESIGGVGTFDVLADGIVDSNQTVSTTTSGIGNGVGFSLPLVSGYPYSLHEDFTKPWLVTMACTDADGNEIPSSTLIAPPGKHLKCTITNSLAVRVIINKFYDFVDPAPATTQMLGSWSDTPFDVETGVEYITTVTHGTYTVTEMVDSYAMSAICDVVLDGEVISTTVDNGFGSVSFFAPRGAVVDCAFSNQPLATVTIEKRTIGAAPDVFQFTSEFGSASLMSSDIDDPNPAHTKLVPVMPGASTISESGAGGWTLDAVDCFDANTDFPVDVFIEGDEFTLDGIEVGGQYFCTVYNVASLSVDKTLNDVDYTADDGVYDTTWDVTVTNPFGTAQDVSLSDQYFFAVGAAAGPAEVVSVEGVTLNPEFDGVTDTLLAPTFSVPAGATYTFHVTIPVSIEPDLDEEARLCQATFTGDNVAFTNWVSINDGEGNELAADWACGDIPAPDITVEKRVDAPMVLNDDGSYSQEYILDVSNDGEGYGTFDLYEQPGFSDNTEVLDITFIDPDTDEEVVVDHTGDSVTIAEDYPLGAHHFIEIPVTVRFTVDLLINGEGPDLSTWQCGVDDNDLPVLGLGLYNEAYLYTTELEPQVASACVDLPISNVMIDKTAVGHEYLAADEIAVDFDIVATNVIDEDHQAPLAGIYVIQDFLGIAGGSGGISPFDIELLGVDGVDPETEITEYDIAPDEGMLAYGLIQPGNTHTWHVRVSYQIDLAGFNGTCPTPTGPGGAYNVSDLGDGFGGMANGIYWGDIVRAALALEYEFNIFPFFGIFGSTNRVGGSRTERAVVIDVGVPFPIPIGEEYGIGISLDCVDVSTISVDKTVVNDNGFDAEAGDFEFELLQDFDGDVERTINAGAPYAIVTDDYALVEVEDDRYTPGDFECEVFPLDGPSDPGKPAPEELLSEPGRIELEMNPSTGYSCSITNDDVSVDLEISIDDGGATAVAGGAPITYTISGGIDGGAVAPGDDVTVTATLEPGWSWVPGTVVGCTGATIVGRVLTCVLPAATVNEDDVAITAQARLAADAASGGYTALATIGNNGDPSPEEPMCDEPNAGCDETPAIREASITATKVSNAVGGNVARGATLKYTLTVTNQGPSTLLPGTQVTDDLPAGLTFVSASGAGWLCNSGDPLVCTNDTVVAPNTALPPLVVTTKVDNTASGTIVNIGVFTAIVDQEAVAQPTGLVGQRRTEAVIAKATATASAAASVTVKSGSGGRGLPSTGVEGFAPTMWVSALTLSLGALALVFARRRRPARG
ncbi:MAG: hypothetical protein ABMA25_06595 [Ilumatobacteraceae bacterium]